eukprot:CAMPEP_0117422698 /NCGR_PEP_ID=MMETSP0758-20121206/3488_1 /TAXON_ID=63605 /ORGANISM="Percolomonas cosmopolitus, Strain AE-1 (ATCC 50343)" /LENGTH=426 /DNA_ID=CAMNT_0005205479 /DNA_START=271 /DNA_END=1548 /DNA_ORIENTATION=-
MQLPKVPKGVSRIYWRVTNINADNENDKDVSALLSHATLSTCDYEYRTLGGSLGTITSLINEIDSLKTEAGSANTRESRIALRRAYALGEVGLMLSATTTAQKTSINSKISSLPQPTCYLRANRLDQLQLQVASGTYGNDNIGSLKTSIESEWKETVVRSCLTSVPEVTSSYYGIMDAYIAKELSGITAWSDSYQKEIQAKVKALRSAGGSTNSYSGTFLRVSFFTSNIVDGNNLAAVVVRVGSTKELRAAAYKKLPGTPDFDVETYVSTIVPTATLTKKGATFYEFNIPVKYTYTSDLSKDHSCSIYKPDKGQWDHTACSLKRIYLNNALCRCYFTLENRTELATNDNLQYIVSTANTDRPSVFYFDYVRFVINPIIIALYVIISLSVCIFGIIFMIVKGCKLTSGKVSENETSSKDAYIHHFSA